MQFPSTDTGTIHLIECCFGKLGRSILETDTQAASEAHIVADIVSGQVDQPIVRVLALKLGEPARDVTREIGELVFDHFNHLSDSFRDMPAAARDLAERAGHDLDAIDRANEEADAEWSRHQRTLGPSFSTHL